MSPVFERKRYHPVCACTDGIKVRLRDSYPDLRSSPDAWHANCWAKSRQKAQGTSRNQAALPSACTHTPSMPARMPQKRGTPHTKRALERPPAHLRVCTRAAPHSPLRWDERTARSSLETGRDGDEGWTEEDGGGAGLRGAREPSPVLRNGAEAFHNARSGISGDEVEGSGGWMTLNSREIRFRVGETQRKTFRAGVGCARRQARRRTEDLKLIINWKNGLERRRQTDEQREGEATRQKPIES
ncbi:hypothetical protein B0H14DRAFT_2837005, partial [Mycena olivaceomarginata]